MGDDGIGGYRDEQMPIVTSPPSPLARDAEGELERSSGEPSDRPSDGESGGESNDEAMDEEVEDVDAFEDPDDVDREEVGVKDEILRLAAVELEAEAALGDASLPLLDALGAAPSAPEASLVPSVPTPQTGISIPMMATPRFVRQVPEEAELLYTAPETLFDEIVRAEAERISQPEQVRNRIVYDSVGDPFKAEASPPSFSQGPDARPGGVGFQPRTELKSHLAPYYTPTGPDDRTLFFESRFESGNLRRAVQAYEFEYDLILNPDYNTKSHTQWYFFRVSNTRRGPQYRFNIINMVKPTSVYNEGMRPLQYSCIQASKGIGWVRCGDRIAYYQNGLRRQKGANYYTLTFTVTFEHDCDEVYFSHCYPYTYSDLQMDLLALEKDPNMVRRLRRRKLCDTLAGNACDLITITSFCSDPAALKARRAVVITARVHPGESNASWVMKGILDYLTGSSVDARILRENFVFKIVPMLNPDGVIVGNYRCSLAGQEKIFPGLLCRSSDCFSFDDCCFKIQKTKDSTARVVAYRELGVVNSYTLEASFCGADFGPLGEQHFTTRHLEEMGYMVCDAILDFCDPDQGKVMLVCKELQVLFPDDGNSDDVSDSEDDGSAALRRKKRQARKATKQREKPKKKKASKMKEEEEEDKRKEKESKDSKEKARSTSNVRKVHQQEDKADRAEREDEEKGKRKKKSTSTTTKGAKNAAKSRPVTSRDKDKTPKDRPNEEDALSYQATKVTKDDEFFG